MGAGGRDYGRVQPVVIPSVHIAEEHGAYTRGMHRFWPRTLSFSYKGTDHTLIVPSRSPRGL